MSATPILDLELPLPEPKRKRNPWLVGLFSGLITLSILMLADRGMLPHWNLPAFNGLLLIPALYVAIASHEIGHLVTGKLVGLEAGGISVGPFQFARSGRNWVFRFDRRMWLGGFYKPLANTAEFNPAHYAWMVAGGPLASVILAGLAALTWTLSGNGRWNWTGTLFWASLFLAAISAVPYSSGLVKSDFALFRYLTRHPEQARSWMALLALQSEEAKGLLPREWNAELVRLVADADSSLQEYLYCQVMAYYRRLDEGRHDEALQHLENALAASAPALGLVRQAVFLEAVAASALLRRRSKQAQTWFDRAARLGKPELADGARAAIAMSEGRYDEAVVHWQAVNAYVDARKLDSGLIRFCKENWARYEALCQSHRSTYEAPAVE